MANTYINPVYPRYFADPFVLKHKGNYYAYGTNTALPEEMQFSVLESRDLVNWESRGKALISPGGDEFWAPEVAYFEGNFYLYYSAHGIGGHDHQLRVAVSETPLGPFIDSGRVLIPDEPFTIDAHPFQDCDGQWYLFYSKDFLTLDGEYRVGTGIVVDRMINMLTLAGDARLVVRPYADWQLFKAKRKMYNSVYDWYTVEGAATRLHSGRYYCFYSGGAWEHDNYGIAYVVADHPLGPYSPVENANLLMKSVLGKVIGPGHNSFAVSPDGNEEVIVYHGWDANMQDRLMRVDRLHWYNDTPYTNGPTWDPQPAFGDHG